MSFSELCFGDVVVVVVLLLLLVAFTTHLRILASPFLRFRDHTYWHPRLRPLGHWDRLRRLVTCANLFLDTYGLRCKFQDSLSLSWAKGVNRVTAVFVVFDFSAEILNMTCCAVPHLVVRCLFLWNKQLKWALCLLILSIFRGWDMFWGFLLVKTFRIVLSLKASTFKIDNLISQPYSYGSQHWLPWYNF
jgi:hypothetical protein